MSLRNACTFSVCAICNTLRQVVVNFNSWRLQSSKQIASKRITSWQAIRKPSGCRALFGGATGSNLDDEVLLVCQPCLDLVAAIDELDTKLESMMGQLWEKMKAPAVTTREESVEYEVIYGDGRKEFRREVCPVQVQEIIPKNVEVLLPTSPNEDEAMLLLRLRHPSLPPLEKVESFSSTHGARPLVTRELIAEDDSLSSDKWVPGSEESTLDSSDSGLVSFDHTSPKAEFLNHSPDGKPSTITDRKLRKRYQNKEAALRYRMKKKVELTANLKVLADLQERNRGLRRIYRDCVMKVDGAKELHRSMMVNGIVDRADVHRKSLRETSSAKVIAWPSGQCG